MSISDRNQLYYIVHISHRTLTYSHRVLIRLQRTCIDPRTFAMLTLSRLKKKDINNLDLLYTLFELDIANEAILKYN